MAKFSGPSVTPGQTQPVVTPGGGSSIIAGILEETPQAPVAGQPDVPTQAAPTAPSGAQTAVEDVPGAPTTAEIDDAGYEALQTAALQQEQRARERVPGLAERLGVTSFEDYAAKQDDPIGGALTRGVKTGQALTYDPDRPHVVAQLPTARREQLAAGQTEAAFGGVDAEGNVVPASKPLLKGSNINIGTSSALYHPEVLNAGVINANGYLEPDPEFGIVASLSVENWLHNEAENQGVREPDPADIFNAPSEGPVPGTGTEVAKAKGNQALGREIYRNWMRHKAAREGRPTDEYVANEDNISPDTFTFIGDMMKEAYSLANPDILYRPPQSLEGEQVYFQLTPEGAADLRNIAEKHKGLFGSQEVAPLNAVSETAQPVYEGKTQVRGVTTKVGELGDTSRINESIGNYHSVSFINDAQRESLALQFAFLGLINHSQDNVYANSVKVGAARRQEVEGARYKMETRIAQLEQAPQLTPREERELARLKEILPTYDVNEILRNDRNKFLGILDATAKYSGKANHLTFSLQALTGRTHVQQTHYNPQSHTFLRFVTGSGNKFSWKPGDGSIIDRNFREIMASMFLKDKVTGKKAKDLTTEERLRLFEEELAAGGFDNYIAMGQQIGQANREFDAAGAKALIGQIANAQSPQEANQLKAQVAQQFGTDPLSDDVKAELNRHGDEALWFANGLVELAKYKQAKDQGRPMVSSITVEMDGKTHGPATNAAQLGIKPMSRRTGLLRTPDYTLTDDIDSREAMGVWMKDNVGAMAGTLFPQDQFDAYTGILDLAVADRANFLKKSPMTMGYGQELGSLKMHVETTVFSGPSSQPIQKIIAANPAMDTEAAIDFLHTMLVDSIFEVMDPKVVAISRLLRANNLLSTMTNKVLYMDNAIGFRSYAAAKQMDPTQTESVSYRVKGTDTPGRSAKFYREQAEGSAEREFEAGEPKVPGGFGHGRVVPIVVQSYDGNMVSRTGSGASWDRIDRSAKSRGAKPFVLPVFDAFVTDLGSFDIVRDEANRNWIDGLESHSYVTSIMKDWYTETTREFNKEMDALPQDQKITVDENGPWRGIHWLLGTPIPGDEKGRTHLFAMLKKVIQADSKPQGMTIGDYQQRIAYQAGGVYARTMKKLGAAGITDFSELTPPQLKRVVAVVSDELMLARRNATAVRTIEKDKAELFKEFRSNKRDARQVDIA